LLLVFKKYKKKIKKELHELEERQQKYSDQILKNAKQIEDLLKFNVQGTIFIIPKDIILQFKGSYFGALIHSNMQKNFEGAYWIKSSPDNFSKIVKFMNTQILLYEDMNETALSSLKSDFEYFGIPFPIQFNTEETTPLEWSICPKTSLLSEGNKVVTKVSGGRTSCAILGSKVATRYKVQFSKGDSVLIGFVAKENFNPEGTNFNKSGNYYILGKSGNLYPGGKLYYQSQIAEGWVIECIHDKQNSTISFIINGINNGIAFRDVTGDCYPALDIGEEGISVKLVD